jgi:hypothetical protein
MPCFAASRKILTGRQRATERPFNPQPSKHIMAAVSESIVREYFELHEFLVRQHRKFFAPNLRAEDDDIDFFVLNPKPQAPTAPLPFVLGSGDLAFIERAVVVVKAWHTETFSTARLEASPEIFRFVEPKGLQQAVKAFGRESVVLKILVVPALPQEAEARDKSVALLRAKGIDGVIPFHTMLTDLVEQIETNRNYQKSDVLQMIRILKNYDFFREPQLELFKAKRKRR